MSRTSTPAVVSHPSTASEVIGVDTFRELDVGSGAGGRGAGGSGRVSIPPTLSEWPSEQPVLPVIPPTPTPPSPLVKTSSSTPQMLTRQYSSTSTPYRTAGSEHLRRMRQGDGGILSPLDRMEPPPRYSHVPILSPPGIEGDTPSPPRTMSRSISPIRNKEAVHVQPLSEPHFTPPRYRPSESPYRNGPICPPPPGMTEVYVVEWSPHPDPQVLEVQRGGAGVQPCAVLHLHGVRHTVIPAESLVDVSVSGSMWMLLSCSNGEIFKIRPRSSQDYGPLAEALGALYSVGESAASTPLRTLKPGKKGPQRTPSPWAPYVTQIFYISRVLLLIAVTVCAVYFTGDVVYQWGTSPLVTIRHHPTPVIGNLTLPTCRVRESSADCLLYLINCGSDYTCSYNHTEVARQVHEFNVTTIFGLFGPSAQGSRTDNFLTKLGSVLTLSEVDGSLSGNSLDTLSSLVHETCPKHFRIG
eukprot:TRINITY_DN7129_c0_g1_i1.p1 TRINITY_DN7129_c0_g1~~TRINITY_DN7129_c0_g1_i1.p1  ORF type:complete len:492 (+),score=39.56 TRINITY_DN7129_c0_g1_i1:72-1478(+)